MYPKKALNSEYTKNSYKQTNKQAENPIEKNRLKVEQILYKRRYLKGQLTKEIDGYLTKEDI